MYIARGKESPMDDVRHIRRVVYLCEGRICGPAGGEETTEALRTELRERGVRDVLTVRTRCTGFCRRAPVVCVQPEGVWYGGMGPAEARRLVAEHLAGGRVLEDRRFWSERDPA